LAQGKGRAKSARAKGEAESTIPEVESSRHES